MNIKDKITQFKKELDIELGRFLELKTKEAAKISPLTKEILEQISDLTLRGGKRIRSALLYYSYLGFGGEDQSKALKVAMSMEFAETYLLIHDDIIDNDAVRRGGVTLHEYFQDRCLKHYLSPNAKSYGESMAILAGDTAASLSNEILLESGFKSELVNKATLELNRIYRKVILGEALDIESEHDSDFEKKGILLVHKMKTAPYTFGAPIFIGAILAGKALAFKNINKIAEPLGVAYQVQDDILGMFGDETKLGKPADSDLKEGKKTLLILKALERAAVSDKVRILKAFGNQSLKESEVEEIRGIVRNSGSLKYSQELVESLTKKAVAQIEDIGMSGEGKTFLLELASYISKREL